MSRWSVGSICFLLTCAFTCSAGDVRRWTDNSGKNSVEAELISADQEAATLRRLDGTTVRVPFERFSEVDKQFLRENQRRSSSVSEVGDHETANSLATYHDLDRLAREQREAVFVLALYEGFLNTPGIGDEDREKARNALPDWRALAEQKAIRVGRKWMSPDQYRSANVDEIRLIKEAHRLIDIKNDDLAKEKFLEASKANPESVRADFYLGLLNALVAPYAPKADDHFKECVVRLARDEDLLTGTRRANYVAALNNLAIVQARLRRYSEAIAYWRRALAIAPFTPELVQNLGLMSALSQTASYVRIPKEMRRSAGDLYAESTTANGLARFDEKVGWLFIPYVDTFDGSMDSTGDGEMVTVGWCTAFCVGGNYLVTSRYPIAGADSVVVHGGANPSEAVAGKIVALSDDSHLAVIRVDGLRGKPLLLNVVPPRPGQDVVIAGFAAPGLAANTFQHRKATILDPPRFYQNVHVVVHQQISPGVDIFVQSHGLRQLLMHDVITNPALEGAPLIDKTGTVVGVHLGNRPQFGKFGSDHSWAESAAYVLDRISAVTSDLDLRTSTSTEPSELDEKNLEGLASGCIYQLAIQQRSPRLAWSHRIEELHRLQQQGAWTSYEDRTCMACNGRLQLKCPNCTRGIVRQRKRELKYKDAQTGTEIWGSRMVTSKCATCSGKGTVGCPQCHGSGVDGMLR